MGKQKGKTTKLSWAQLSDYLEVEKTMITGVNSFMDEGRFIGSRRFFAHHQKPPTSLTNGDALTWRQYAFKMRRAKPRDWQALVDYYENILRLVLKNFSFKVTKTEWPTKHRVVDKKVLIRKWVTWQLDDTSIPITLTVELSPSLDMDTAPLWGISVNLETAHTKDGTPVDIDTKLAIDDYFGAQGAFYLGLLKMITETETVAEVQKWVDEQVKKIKEARAARLIKVKQELKKLVSQFESDHKDETRKQIVRTLKNFSDVSGDPSLYKIRCDRNSTEWVETLKAL